MLTASSVEQASKMLSLTVASLAVWTSTGPCEVVGTCVQSSGYPLQYENSESCTIVMDPPGAITIHSFRTDSYSDRMVINGHTYYGYSSYSGGCPSCAPTDGIVPTGPITWTSNSYNT